MSLDLQGAVGGLLESPLFGVLLTLAGMAIGQWVHRKLGGHPLANGFIIAIVLVGGFLLVTGIPYATYLEGAKLLELGLGPVTVALAVPLYREAKRIRESAPVILVSVAIGAAVAASTAVLVTRLLGGSLELAASMAPKSATTPVSIAAAEAIGGVGALAAIFTACAGVLGALIGPELLRLLRVRDPRLVGLGLGVVSHAIVTARLLRENPQAAAFSALAMAITGVLTGLLLPIAAPLLLG
jgi:putative effector of murein hydrolase